MKQQSKNLSIELLKFFALLIILNGHSDKLYASCSFLATGGAIGDALFFFCSGFTIFLGRMDRFDNWYKRRISRIYPSVIAWALITALFFKEDNGILWSLLHMGGWFVNCIMIYYVLLYFVRKFTPQKPYLPFVITTTSILLWYYFEDSSSLFMYGQTYFRWCHFFLFMLLGAYVGNGTISILNNTWKNALMLLISFVSFYAIILLSHKSEIISHLQVFSLIPLMGIVYFAYGTCCSKLCNKLISSKIIGGGIRTVASLCLECYIVQGVFLTPKYNYLFPLNLILLWTFILVISYLTRCFSRVIKQLFEKESFRWNEVFQLY